MNKRISVTPPNPRTRCASIGQALPAETEPADDCETQLAETPVVVPPVDYKGRLGRNVKLNAVAKSAAQSSLGHPMLASGLRPIARAKIMGANFGLYANSLSVIQYTRVADPTNSVSNAAYVQAWANRFAGFQQYRIRETVWEIIPIRPLVGTTTSAQAEGFFEVWIDDQPDIGVPSLFAMNDNNRHPVLLNSDKVTRITYRTNEPQDLNLTPISYPPSHTYDATVGQGQHCLQCYGDPTYTGLGNSVASTQVAFVRPIYDIEFFGIGAN